MSHPAFTLLAATLLSVALSLLGNRARRERLCVAAYVILCCAAATLAGGWGMYFIHG